MNIIKYENVVHCDVDDTILKWSDVTVPGPEKLSIEFAGKTVYLTPHTYHVDLLKMYRERGYYIVVWSANGYGHAARAVQALGLEYLVSGDHGHIQGKPAKHMDDSPDAAAILGPRVFVEDFTKPVNLKIGHCTVDLTHLYNEGIKGTTANINPNFSIDILTTGGIGVLNGR